MDKPLWQPNKQTYQHSYLQQFMQQQQYIDYDSLYQWSIDHPEQFWAALAQFAGINFNSPAKHVLQHADDLEKAIWFDGATLNFAEQLLQRRDNHTALIFAGENGERRRMSYAELYQEVAKLTHYLRSIGIKSGDRIAGFMPNCIETVVAMLASTAIGAIWSSCSPDFGLSGLINRFQQIEPSILFAVNYHSYKGHTYDHTDKIAQLQAALPSLQKTIVVPFINKQAEISSLTNAIDYQDCINNKATDITFEAFDFNHPIYILYTSGTTGKPKCMLHGAGGTLLQHKKELMLHTDLHPEDTFFFFTTCGWMMWNWLISGLSIGATLVLYDGFPFYPKKLNLFALIDELKINVFGVGAKHIEFISKGKTTPINTYQLNSLKTILTTGSPLLPESFDYVYQKIKHDVRLSSISGGSDIISCFVLGNPLLPVYRGEIQCRGLGMKVEVFDDDGSPVREQQGELVCTAPFPSMPVCFWNDKDGEKYHNAYFSSYPNVWAHGDYAKLTKHNGMIIYGRSDATLNPKGVRVGTAEIYNQVDKIPEILDCIAVGQNWQGNQRIVLFVKLRDGISLGKDLLRHIKATIRNNTSPHHVPAKIMQVPDIPRTISGKNVEIAVKKILDGKPIKNGSALANPESLDFFRHLDERLHWIE